MTQKYSRAQRRADYARIKDKRQFHWGYGHKNNWSRDSKRGEICYMAPQQAGLVARTSTPCSCYMCGNPRRSWMSDHRLTMQERRALDNFNDALDDISGDVYFDDPFQEEYVWDYLEEWYYAENKISLFARWKYCNQLTDSEYMWKVLRGEYYVEKKDT